MQKEPSARYATYEELIAALDAAAPGNVEPAGFAIRAAGAVIDLGLGAAAVAFLGPIGAGAYLAALVAPQAFTGQTAGKWLVRIRAERIDGAKLGIARARRACRDGRMAPAPGCDGRPRDARQGRPLRDRRARRADRSDARPRHGLRRRQRGALAALRGVPRRSRRSIRRSARSTISSSARASFTCERARCLRTLPGNRGSRYDVRMRFAFLICSALVLVGCPSKGGEQKDANAAAGRLLLLPAAVRSPVSSRRRS